MSVPTVPNSLPNLVVVKDYLDRLVIAINSGGAEVDPIFLSQKGAADGVATLNGSSRVPDAQLGSGVANGVATLNGSSHVPTAQLGSGTADSTTFLRGDGSWIVISTPTNVWNQGGNAFGAEGVFGTNDAFDIAFRAGGVERMRLINTSNILQGNGGFTVRGGTGSGNGLTLASTSHATKGKVFFASDSAFDESSSRWGFGNPSPSVQWDFYQTAPSATDGHLKVRTSVGTFFEVNLLNNRVDLLTPGESLPRLRFEPGVIYFGNGFIQPPSIKISSFDSRIIIDDNNTGLTPPGIDIVHYGGFLGATASTLVTRTARGTVGSPTPIINNTPILLITTTGWDTVAFLTGSQISVEGAETWTPTAHGCRIAFANAPVGGTTLANNLIIQPDGALQIGPSAGSGRYITFPERSSDPATVSNFGHLYTKDVSTVTQLFFRADDGTVSQLTPPASSSPPASQIVESTTPEALTAVFATCGGMTITPAAGTYLVWFNAWFDGSGFGRGANIRIAVDSTPELGSVRTEKSDGGTSDDGIFCMSTMARVTVNGSQAINGQGQQVLVSTDIQERSLMIVAVS